MQIIFPVSILSGKALRRNFQPMRNRAFRSIAAIISVMLLAGTPAPAGPVAIHEVMQVLGGYQNSPELQLRSVSPAGAPVLGVNGSTQVTSAVKQSLAAGSVDVPDTSTTGLATNNSTDSLLSGAAVSSDVPQTSVDVIAQGDLEGTICDCGEITVPGGIPKWPLLFLAAIPFFFIHGCDDCDTPTGTPTPTPPGTHTPEPASLLLFGSALAAFGTGMRRRYARAKLAAQITKEG
jgi:hypothetical protein